MINLIAIQPPVAFADESAARGAASVAALTALMSRLAQRAAQWIAAEPQSADEVLARAKRYESSQPSYAADLRAAACAASR